ncbi:glycosyltransferase [Oryzobacter terrae]|uniref:glycosyltransferase n=1 Tax=Oryzobacter terrae TaxID=1620385 RepID=UPI0036734B13
MSTRPPSVLLVVGAMNRGGIESWLMNVARAVPPEEVRLTFLVHSDRPSDFDDEIRALGHHLAVCRLGRDPVGYAVRLARLMRSEGPFDAVHAFVSTFSALPLTVARLVGVPVRIAHSQTDRRAVLATAGPARRAYSALASWGLRRSMTLGMACTVGASEFLFRRDPQDDPRIRVVPNAIDPRPFADAVGTLRADLMLPDDALVVGHVARFVPVKNQGFLVEVARRWAAQGDPVHLVLVGEGPDRPAVEATVAAAGLTGRVHLTGLRTDIPGVMADLDVLVLPSLWEGAPITLVEAQASGVPCVVSAEVTGATDVVPGLVTSMPTGAGADAWAAEVLAAARRPGPSRADAQAVLVDSAWNLDVVVPVLRAAWSGEDASGGRRG